MIMPILDFGGFAALATWALNALGGFTLALLAVLLLRRPLRWLSGPRAAYALWLLPPAAVLVTLWAALAPLASPLRWHGVGVNAGALVIARGVSIGSASAPISAGAVLLSLWLVGCVLALVVLALRYLALRRELMPAPAEPRAVQTLLRDIARKPRIRVHAAGPALLWAPRPLLLLPADFTRRYSRAQQAHILRHELCHRAQGDAWWNLLAALLGALFWMHPLLPWARRCFLLDQELSCDALLLQRHRAAPRAYADTLLLAATGAVLPLASGVAHPRQLKERIAMLAQTRRSLPRRAVGAALILVLLSGAVLAAPSPAPVAAHTVAGMNPPTQDVSVNNKLPPRYPISAVKAHEQGTVYLAVLVGTQGMPLSIKQVHKPGPQPAQDLVNASLLAAAQWRFNPATRHGKPVAGWIEVPITFEISPSEAPASKDAHKPSA